MIELKFEEETFEVRHPKEPEVVLVLRKPTEKERVRLIEKLTAQAARPVRDDAGNFVFDPKTKQPIVDHVIQPFSRDRLVTALEFFVKEIRGVAVAKDELGRSRKVTLADLAWSPEVAWVSEEPILDPNGHEWRNPESRVAYKVEPLLDEDGNPKQPIEPKRRRQRVTLVDLAFDYILGFGELEEEEKKESGELSMSDRPLRSVERA